jgi:ribosomal protein S8
VKRLPELLYKLRNGYKKNLSVIKSSYYKTWKSALYFLYEEGFIQNFQKANNGKVYIYLRYHQGKSSIRNIKNFVKSSRPIYIKYKELWQFSRQGGLLLISTSKGILSHEECIRQKLGGKLLFYVA